MTTQSYKDVSAALGKFVWYYPPPAPAAGPNLISAPAPRPDGKPMDATIIGVNDDGTVEIRAWRDSTPHEMSNVKLYDGKEVGYPCVVYPGDDQGRIKQEADRVKHEADAAAKEEAAAKAKASK